jgi:predicted transcriptional regulator
MLEENAYMNQTTTELNVLRKQVNQLKKIIENKNVTITKLRSELTDVKQDRSNMLTEWAEMEHYYARESYKNTKDEDDDS